MPSSLQTQTSAAPPSTPSSRTHPASPAAAPRRQTTRSAPRETAPLPPTCLPSHPSSCTVAQSAGPPVQSSRPPHLLKSAALPPYAAPHESGSHKTDVASSAYTASLPASPPETP